MITKADIEKRIALLRDWEQQADKDQRLASTEFKRGRFFGNSERLESEIFFLEALICEPVLNDLNDINLTK